MSTQKWSDDELDDFFRKASGEADPTYDSAAWQDMETRLDNRDRTILGAKLLRWGLPALLLLLFTGGFIWYSLPLPAKQRVSATTGQRIKESVGTTASARQKHPAGPAPAPITSVPERPEPNNATDDAGKQPSAADRSFTATNPVPRRASTSAVEPEVSSSLTPTRTSRALLPVKPSSLPLNHPALTDRPVKSAPFIGSDNRSTSIFRKRSGNGVRRIVTKKTGRVGPSVAVINTTRVAGYRNRHANDIARQDATPGGLGRHRSVGSGLVTNRTVADEASTDGTTGAAYYVPASLSAGQPNQADPPADSDRFGWPVLHQLPGRGAKWPALPPIAAEPTLAETAPASVITRPARTIPSGLSVQLVLSPDLSTIGLRNFDRPGSNIGLLAQYQLSERFSVQAGALWSTKLYTTTPSEYTSPVYMHVVPERITGRCTLFDIPVNLRYDVLLRPGGAMRGPKRWFVSGGLTSYFINHEVYSYTFKNPNDPGITAKGWDNRKGGSFGLSNLNISVGYEQPISRRLSWQVEPFMKIPLKQVGSFKVKLISTGAFLSLRYRL